MILMTVLHLFRNTITQHTPKCLELQYIKLLQKLCYLVYDLISRAGMKVRPCSSEILTPSTQTMVTKSNKPNQILICWVSRTYSWMCVLTAGFYQQARTHAHTQTHFIYVLIRIVSGAFAEMRKATMTFVMSVSPVRSPTRPRGTIRLHCRNFHDIWHLSIFRKSVNKIQASLKSAVHEDLNTFMTKSRSFLLRMRNVPEL